jgi:hypothetical protein
VATVRTALTKTLREHRFELTGEAESTTVAVHLFDRWRAPGGKAWGSNRTYADLFTEVAQAVDACLASLDPTMLVSPPEFHSGPRR